MKNRKLIQNKLGKGLISLTTVIILLSSILASTVYFDNNITANAVEEIPDKTNSYKNSVSELDNINELSQLNEGWYLIKDNYVFYLETFDTAIPLNIRVKEPAELNGLAVVDADGSIEFDGNAWRLAEGEDAAAEPNENIITGQVTGLESVSGMQGAPPATQQPAPQLSPQDRFNRIKNENLKTLGERSGGALIPNNDKYGSYSFKDNDDTRKIYVQSDGSLFISSGQNGRGAYYSDTYNDNKNLGIKTPRDSNIPFRIETTVKYSNGNTQNYYLKNGQWYLTTRVFGVPYTDYFNPDSKISDGAIYSDINQYIYDNHGANPVTEIKSRYWDTTNSGTLVNDNKNNGQFRTYMADRSLKLAEAYSTLVRPATVLYYVRQAEAANPPDAPTLNRMGSVYQRWGNNDAAIPNYEKAVRADPQSNAYASNLNRAKMIKIEGWSYDDNTQRYSPVRTDEANKKLDANRQAMGILSYFFDTSGARRAEELRGNIYFLRDGSILYETGQNDPIPTQVVVDGKPYAANSNLQRTTTEIIDFNKKIAFTPQERTRKQWVNNDGTIKPNLPNSVSLGGMFSDEQLFITTDDETRVAVRNPTNGRYYFEGDPNQYAAVKGGEVVSQQTRFSFDVQGGRGYPDVVVESVDDDNGRIRYDNWYRIEEYRYAYFSEDGTDIKYIIAAADGSNSLKVETTEGFDGVRVGDPVNIIAGKSLPENTFIEARDTYGEKRIWIKLPGGADDTYYYLDLSPTHSSPPTQDEISTIRANYDPNTETLTPYAATGEFDVDDSGIFTSAPALTDEEIEDAKDANNDPANTQRVSDFRRYLTREGYTQDSVNGILGDPQKIRDWQLWLGVNPDGIINQDTISAISRQRTQRAQTGPAAPGTGSPALSNDEIERLATNRLTDDFVTKIDEIAAELGLDPDKFTPNLLRNLNAESGFNPSAENKRAKEAGEPAAVGIMQWLPSTLQDMKNRDSDLKDVDVSPEAVKRMSAIEQTKLIKSFYKLIKQDYPNLDLDDPDTLYKAMIQPRDADKPNNFVIARPGSKKYILNSNIAGNDGDPSTLTFEDFLNSAARTTTYQPPPEPTTEEKIALAQARRTEIFGGLQDAPEILEKLKQDVEKSKELDHLDAIIAAGKTLDEAKKGKDARALESAIRNLEDKEKRYQQFLAERDLPKESMRLLALDANDPDYQFKDIAKRILDERLKKAADEDLDDLLENDWETLYQNAQNNPKIKEYIKKNELQGSYDIYTSVKKQCPKCTYDEDTESYRDEEGNRIQLKVPSGKRREVESKLQSIPNIGDFDIIEGDGYLILKSKKNGGFFYVEYDSEGDLIAGEDVDMLRNPPKRILIDGKERSIVENTFTKDFRIVYRDVLGDLYDQAGKAIKDGDVVTQLTKKGQAQIEVSYEVKQGRINLENPIDPKVGGNSVSPQTFRQLVALLGDAGEKADIVREGSTYTIVNDKGRHSALTLQVTQDGIVNGNRIDTNPLGNIFLNSEITDGRTTVKINKAVKKVEKRDSQGNIIKDSKGSPITEDVVEIKSWTKEEQREITRNGKTYTQTLDSRRIFETDKATGKQNPNEYTETTIDRQTKEPIRTKFVSSNVNVEFDYEKGTVNYNAARESQNEMKFDDFKKTDAWAQLSEEDKKKLEKLNSDHKKWSSRQTFASIERILTEFRGLEYYATLFFDEDYLLEWRNNVDKIFAKSHLGIEYWTSDICDKNLDGEQQGVAFADTPQGLAQVAAHIEATRSDKIVDEKGQATYIYKITFNVRNGDYEKDMRAPENMSINVYIGNSLIAEGAKTGTKILKEDKNIGRGSSYGKMGTSAIVQESNSLYTEICMTFDKIPLKWKIKNKTLCNRIQASGAPSKLERREQAADVELNDF